MNLVSVRIITADIDQMVAFYARVTGAEVDRPVPDFAELRTPNGTLALGVPGQDVGSSAARLT